MREESDADIVVTRVVAPPAPSHLMLVYVEEANEGAGQAAGDLLLLSPFESAVPSRLEDARYWSVSFMPEAVAESGRADVYFYWLCNPLFFAFVATRGKPLKVPQDERLAWSATLSRLELEIHGHHSGFRQATKALLTLLLVDAARLALVTTAETLDISPLLARVFDVVEARFRETLSLSDVAAAVHLTPRSPHHASPAGYGPHRECLDHRTPDGRGAPLAATDRSLRCGRCCGERLRRPGLLHEAVQAATRRKPTTVPPAAQGRLNIVQEYPSSVSS